MASVVDGDRPAITRMLIRPEWWGETAGEVTADVAWRAATPCSHELDGEQASVQLVNGATFKSRRLDVRAGGNASSVSYTARLGAAVDLGTYRPYKNCSTATESPACDASVSYWKPEGLAALVAESVRRASGSEIAVVAAEIVDDSYAKWIDRDVRVRGTGWLSRYVLERVLFQSPRFVRA